MLLDRLAPLVAATGADEVMIATGIYDHAFLRAPCRGVRARRSVGARRVIMLDHPDRRRAGAVL